MMQTRTKVVLVLFFIAVLLASVASYYRYMVVGDFVYFTEGFTLEEGN